MTNSYSSFLGREGNGKEGKGRKGRKWRSREKNGRDEKKREGEGGMKKRMRELKKDH